MTDGWSIRLPYRDRDEPLLDVADNARALDSREDRAVARSLALDGATSGLSTVGQLIDKLDAMAPHERRATLDAARQRAGLPTTREIDAQRARRVRAQMIPDTPPRDEGGLAYQTCAAEGCGQYPRSREGATIPVKARRWWCPAHEHLAAPGDLEPWTQRIEFAPGGALQFPDEVERDIEIAKREAERRAAELEQRRAQRRAEWEANEVERVARADQFRRALLPGAPR